MDSAHAELLASEAWRNICDTFLLLVSPLAAAAQGEAGAPLSRSESVPALRVGCQISVAIPPGLCGFYLKAFATFFLSPVQL